MYCTTELCLSVDKTKKNKERTMLVYSVYVMYIRSHVENWDYLHFHKFREDCWDTERRHPGCRQTGLRHGALVVQANLFGQDPSREDSIHRMTWLASLLRCIFP